MSTTYNVVGIKSPDEKWKKMKAVWDACTAADLQVPDEVDTYFNQEEPNPNGVRVDVIHTHVARPYSGENAIEVDLSVLPEDVTHIQFVISR